MKHWITRVGWTVVAIVIVGTLASCGGGDDSSPPPPPPPPPPLTITTTTLPASFYGEFYSATLQSSGGTGAKTWSISPGSRLPAGLNLDRANGVISGIRSFEGTGITSFEVTVRDSAAKVATKTLELSQDQRAPNILTTTLPDAIVGRPYSVRIASTQPGVQMLLDPTPGIPPPGIVVGQSQNLMGTPTLQGTFSFTLQLFTDHVVAQRVFTLAVVGQGSGNRNDDVANARPLSSGTYSASISPLVDPVNHPVAHPDNDYYKLTAQPGSTVSIEVFAERSAPLSPLDSVIELVDGAGNRLNSCDSPGQSGLTHSCVNDDNQEEATLDSKLVFRAPSGAPSTFFLHVVDWRGDGRPDMLYQFQIFGAD